MRVLIVEDSEPLRKPVVKALKASGYAVDSTGDGKEGFGGANARERGEISGNHGKFGHFLPAMELAIK